MSSSRRASTESSEIIIHTIVKKAQKRIIDSPSGVDEARAKERYDNRNNRNNRRTKLKENLKKKERAFTRWRRKSCAEARCRVCWNPWP